MHAFRRFRATTSLLLLAIAAPVAVACRPQPAPRTVLLVVVDTLRADRLGLYGNSRPTSPHLDELGRDSIVYQRAYAQAPWTTASIASLLTSRFPRTLGIAQESSILDERWRLLPELFRAAGYRTGAVVSHTFCSRRWGFDQGFESFDESSVGAPEDAIAPGVSDAGIAFLDAHPEEPVFLFLHYFDPHFSYVEHEGFRFAPAPGYRGPIADRVRAPSLRHLRDGLSQADVHEMQRVYDSEVAWVDHHIGRVLDALHRSGRYAGAAIVVTADHGEEFLDHGSLGHGRTLYDEQLHVPLLVKLPGRAAGLVDDPVALLDVFPTLAAVAGLSLDGGERGVDLLDREPPGSRPLFAETERFGRFRSVRLGGFKLIENTRTGAVQLFDLRQDPGERRNLAEHQRRRLSELENALEQWRVTTPRGPVLREIDLSAEERERLKALGYLEGPDDGG